MCALGSGLQWPLKCSSLAVHKQSHCVLKSQICHEEQFPAFHAIICVFKFFADPSSPSLILIRTKEQLREALQSDNFRSSIHQTTHRHLRGN